MSEMREKYSLESGRMYIKALKSQKFLGPALEPWTPATDNSLMWLCFTNYISNFQSPKQSSLGKILDPHLLLASCPCNNFPFQQISMSKCLPYGDKIQEDTKENMIYWSCLNYGKLGDFNPK